MTKLWGLATGIVALMLVSGCAGTPTQPSEADSREVVDAPNIPAPASTAPPSASAVLRDAPGPRTSIGCDDALPAAVVATVLGSDVFPLDVATDVAFDSPITAAPAGRGALLCSWGVETRAPWWNSQSAFGGALLSITPVTDDEWMQYGTTYSYKNGDAMHTWCWPIREGTESSCYFEGRVKGYFLEFRSSRLAGGADLTEEALLALIQPVIDGISAGLDPEMAIAEPWTPAHPSLALPTECGDLLTPAQAESLTGESPLSVFRFWDGPSRGTAPVLSLFTGASRKCDIVYADRDSSVGSVDAMVDGAWAGADRMAAHLALGDATVAVVPGLAAEEQATLRCDSPDDPCVVDFTLEGNWIQVSAAWEPPDRDGDGVGDGPSTAVARQNILEIAGAVVANLTT